jgi:hypothetical protein
MPKNFDSLDDIEVTHDDTPAVSREVGDTRIITYGTLDRRRLPNEEKKVKIPLWVIDLIEKHAEEGANHTLIYTRMIELAARHYEKLLVVSDIEIKY